MSASKQYLSQTTMPNLPAVGLRRTLGLGFRARGWKRLALLVVLVAGAGCGRGNSAEPVLTVDNSLYVAAARGDVQAVERHLANGVDVDERRYPHAPPPYPSRRSIYGNPTPLQGAVGSVKPEVVRILLAHGANVNARVIMIGGHSTPDSGKTALELAMFDRNSRVCVRGGGKPDLATDLDGIIAQLLAQKPDPNFMGDEGAGPLMELMDSYVEQKRCGSGYGLDVLPLIKSLLDLGVAASAQTEPIRYAAEVGANDVLLLFVEAGASEQQLNLALMAASSGRPETVKFLLDHGANPNYRAEGGGPSPLHRAVGWKNLACVRLLLDAGADPNASAVDGKRPAELDTSDEIREEFRKRATLLR